MAAPSPVAADNAVPDITPKLQACGTGAVLAWSRYDGNDYRLHLARLDQGSWNEPAMIGAAGSLYPTFISAPDEDPRLLVRVASTGSWSTYELDASGSLSRQASVSSAPRRRPVVTTTPDGNLSFRWSEAPQELTTGWLPAELDTEP